MIARRQPNGDGDPPLVISAEAGQIDGIHVYWSANSSGASYLDGFRCGGHTKFSKDRFEIRFDRVDPDSIADAGTEGRIASR